jgi:peptide/nickel transport system substrate-binding protein
MRNLVFLILFLLSSACSKISLSQSSLLTFPDVGDKEKSQINSREKFQSRFGGTLKLTQRGQDAKTLNPWTSTEGTSGEYGSLMFPGLVKFNPDTDMGEPLLAEGFEISKDEKTITVKLRENLYWSDGQPITADDVLFTWNELLIQGIALSSARDVININGKFPEITKLDERTIEFKTSEVFAPFLRNLGIEIAPKHDLERFFKKHKAKTFSEKQKAFEKYLSIFTKPEDIVSSGPFKFSKIQRGERIEFVRNPLYYDVDTETGKRLPYFNRLIYSYVQDDSADIFKFLAKESDVLGVSPANAALAKELSKKYNYTACTTSSSEASFFIKKCC